VNNLNQLTNQSRTGKISVAGATSSAATNVTVNTTNGILYADQTFVSTNHTLANGANTFTAIAQDNLGRTDTHTITTYLPESSAFVYDANGNMVFDGQKAFEYDDENQLTGITVTNAWKSEFTYDGKMRRRVRKEYTWRYGVWTLTNAVRYIYDGNLVIQERDANNIAQVSYTRGKDLSGSLEGAGGIGGLLARTDNRQPTTGNGQSHAYYHADGNGNITMLINTQQVAVAKYFYDPFGSALSKNGSLAEVNSYQFSSKETHEKSALSYYGFRYYMPNLQRWLNRDPLGEEGFEGIVGNRSQWIDTSHSEDRWTPDAPNLYLFVENRPTMEIDAFGLLLGFGHGNWCGYSRSGEGGYPIDAVDAACEKHDKCLATWPDACKFKFCNVKFCADVAGANCHGNKACKKAKLKIMAGCVVIVPIPPFIHM